VVRHAIYAAGHPPLPSFEAAAFGNATPGHWEMVREKPLRVKGLPGVKRAEFEVLVGYREGEMDEARLVVVGAVVSFRAAMR
jgi:hypothetical protein